MYYAPGLWGTSDGVIAFRRFWAEFVLLGGRLAREQHMAAAAYRLGVGGEEVDSDRARVRSQGWPDTIGD